MGALGGIRRTVDTRSKIVSVSEVPAGGALVAGYFDLVGVEHVRVLDEVRERAARVIAAVLPDPDGAHTVMGAEARAEMAAAFHMVDYVLICARPGDAGDWEDLVRRLKPTEIVSLEEAESRRRCGLTEQVRDGKSR